ncbi:MAG: protein-L-isoaspartate(D-aspartate) O-methyltransferase [Actinomycetota bacterium]|nr:protein-L-isoaspartate(D-aspartate) O-methyltransferase [Actinomycetota bacterium]
MPRSKEGLVRLLKRQRIDPRVVEAFTRVARVDFVPEAARAEAYSDRPVVLPEGQTTSQPSLIARMIEAAKVGPRDRVLEVGTGFGYQTALLAQLADQVVSIERSALLAEQARKNLEQAGIEKVAVLVGDGWKGVPEEAPFDAIVVSAAATEVPPALQDQLAEGGRLVIPVKGASSDEVLLFVRRGGSVERIALLTPARFVPLVKDGVQ